MSIGRWATMGHATPTVFRRGVEIPGSEWNLCVQVAQINTSNVSGATQPAWADITRGVVDVDWDRGDAARESRVPVGQASIRVTRYALMDALGGDGDPCAITTTSINDRFGAGCLFRFGYYNRTSGGWRPLMTGFVDRVDHDWTPDDPITIDPLTGDPYAIYELTCYDQLYYLAGYRQNSTYSAVSGNNAWTAFDTLLSATDFPFNWATAGTVYSTVMVPPSPYQPPLPLLHRLTDTMGCGLFAWADGRLLVNGWDRRQVNSSWYVVDRNIASFGFPAITSSDGEIMYPTRIRWTNSMDRLLYRAEQFSGNVTGNPSQVGRSTTPVLGDRYRWRVDAPGWPMTDTMNTTHPPPWNTDDNATRFREVTRCDSVTFDTQTAVHQPAGLNGMIDFLTAYSEYQMGYRVQRRAYGTEGTFDKPCTVGAITGRIERTNNQHRLTVTHHLRSPAGS